MRTVGGANPYLGLWARARLTRSEVDAELATGSIQEVPSARGCTYVMSHCDCALGLVAGQGIRPDVGMAERYLGFSSEDRRLLEIDILNALTLGALDPKGLREALGEKIRHFGPEGKKRGLTTSLSIGLGSLQAEGKIRRIPTNGRLDQERYAYAMWDPSPWTEPRPTLLDYATAYWLWAGPASVKQFKTFSGLAMRDIQPLVAELELKPCGPDSDLLLLPQDRAAFEQIEAKTEPQVHFVGSLDGILHLRGDLNLLLDQEDLGRSGISPAKSASSLSEVSSHLILDRGRLIGMWEFDPDEGEIVLDLWAPRSDALDSAQQEAATMIRDHLGDARSFSLDTPASRRPRIDAMRRGART